MSADPIEAVYEAYLTGLLKGDYRSCAAILEDLIERGCEIRVIYEGLVQRSLYDVGWKWETNQVSVATEHLATATTERLLTLVYPHIFAREHLPYRVIVSCAANEYHQVGAGWSRTFLN